MKELTNNIIDVGTDKELGSLNDDILQGDPTSNKFVTSGSYDKNGDIPQGDSLGTNLSLVETPINSDIITVLVLHKYVSRYLWDFSTYSTQKH